MGPGVVGMIAMKSCAGAIVVVDEFEAMWVEGTNVICEIRWFVGVWVVWDGGWWWRGTA